MTDTLAKERKTGVGRWIGFAAWDLAVVVSFVLIGRDTHQESIGFSEVVRTGAPFVLAVAGAWLTPMVHRQPWLVAVGIATGVITSVMGLFFRSVVFGEGLSGVFPVVTALYLIGLMGLGRVVFRLWVVGRAAARF
ncbi:MAG: DUF3054 domain-containing protein [bacterium]|nr:DUF3054 domain-containing protein [bacterium]